MESSGDNGPARRSLLRQRLRLPVRCAAPRFIVRGDTAPYSQQLRLSVAALLHELSSCSPLCDRLSGNTFRSARLTNKIALPDERERAEDRGVIHATLPSLSSRGTDSAGVCTIPAPLQGVARRLRAVFPQPLLMRMNALYSVDLLKIVPEPQNVCQGFGVGGSSEKNRAVLPYAYEQSCLLVLLPGPIRHQKRP